MKSILFVLFLGLTALNFSCQNSNDGQVSAPAVSSDCVTNPQTCQSSIYSQNSGFSVYPYGNGSGSYGSYGSGTVFANNRFYNSGATPFYFANSAAYLCNCPLGSVPTYNSYAGLGCVQSQYVGFSGYVALGWGPNNGQWLNIPQISNMTGYPNNSCYNGVVQSCIIGQTNSCAVGSTCRPANTYSNMGLCQRN
jgi:hypothetical protein